MCVKDYKILWKLPALNQLYVIQLNTLWCNFLPEGVLSFSYAITRI